ncbi:uncharacterized protein YunC (DUF1805 family) [Salirhabdus euzebyi]|uniref:Uncharacterized protein YunC (DUF1805 family) n=1 Tax=Salirhabdus euzebyi TaxID=394506 RepID=A0A841Q4Y5_9BACI|nr:DUF1805 domain-containing protein [Salirhabdus euzebyi]MBB6453454.1 uncharacterized protein YunC (DUF1805 family) [Salirhabdus euzebyi]
MVTVEPLWINDKPFTAVQVKLPKTNLMVVSNEVGYIMCGALDVDLLSDKLYERQIVAGRAVGVKTIEDLLEAPLDKVTTTSKEKYGWEEGMSCKDALLRL